MQRAVLFWIASVGNFVEVNIKLKSSLALSILKSSQEAQKTMLIVAIPNNMHLLPLNLLCKERFLMSLLRCE